MLETPNENINEILLNDAQSIESQLRTANDIISAKTASNKKLQVTLLIAFGQFINFLVGDNFLFNGIQKP